MKTDGPKLKTRSQLHSALSAQGLSSFKGLCITVTCVLLDKSLHSHNFSPTRKLNPFCQNSLTQCEKTTCTELASHLGVGKRVCILSTGAGFMLLVLGKHRSCQPTWSQVQSAITFHWSHTLICRNRVDTE